MAEKKPTIEEFRPEQLEHYKIIETLGQGGNGTVYRAFDQKRAQVVALKTLKNPNDVTLSRFKREFFALKQHDHPGIVEVYEAFFEHDPPFFSMEWIKGKTLSQMMDDMERNPLVFNTRDRQLFAIKLGIQVCEILEHIHSFDEIHRDLKPDNLFVKLNHSNLISEFDIKMVDFGLLKQIGEEQVQDTQGGMIVGTVHYLSPEQARSQKLDVRSDLYSLGVILYRILTQRLPHTAEDVVGYLFKTVFENPHPLAELSGDSDPNFRDLLDKLLSKKPEDRFPSAKSLRVALKRLIHDECAIENSVDLSSEDLFDLFEAPLLQPKFVGQKPIINKLTTTNRNLKGLSIVVLHGQEGMGKSELVKSWSDKFVRTSDPFFRLEFREEEIGAQDPVGALMDSLIPSLKKNQIMELFKDIYPYLTGISKFLKSHFDARSVGNLEYLPPSKKLQLLAVNFVKLVQRLTEKGPVYMVLDDLHLAPERFYGWLTLFMEQIADRPLLLIITQNTAKSNPANNLFLERCRERESFWEMNLEPISKEELGELLRSMLPSEIDFNFEQDFIDLFHRRTEGNGFCAVELFSRLYEGKLLSYHRGKIGVSEEKSIQIPLSLDQAILKKIDGLPNESKNMLQVASIFGAQFPFKWLQLMLNWPEETFHQHVYQLMNNHFLEEVEKPHALKFKLDATQKIVYQGIKPKERALLHQRVAKVLEPLVDRDDIQGIETLAFHFQRAQNHVRTIKYQYLAGCRCLEMKQTELALNFFKACLKSLEKSKNTYTMNLVHLKMAELYQINKQHKMAIESYQNVLRLPNLSKIEKFKVLRGLAEAHLELNQGKQALNRAKSLVEMTAGSHSRIHWDALILQGQAHWAAKAEAEPYLNGVIEIQSQKADMEQLPIHETLAKLLSNDIISAAKRIRFLLKNGYQPGYPLLIQFAGIRFAAGHLQKSLNILRKHKEKEEVLPPLAMVLKSLLTYRIKRLIAPDHSADEYLGIAERYIDRFDLGRCHGWVTIQNAEQHLWESQPDKAMETLLKCNPPQGALEKKWFHCLLAQAHWQCNSPNDPNDLKTFRQLDLSSRTFIPLQVAWLSARTAEALLPLSMEAPKLLKSLKQCLSVCKNLGLRLYAYRVIGHLVDVYNHIENQEKATFYQKEKQKLEGEIFKETVSLSASESSPVFAAPISEPSEVES